jgi:hypothetical protein
MLSNIRVLILSQNSLKMVRSLFFKKHSVIIDVGAVVAVIVW